MLLAAAGLMSFSLVACSGEAEPIPTVTITEEAVGQGTQQESESPTQGYLSFVKDSGGLYGALMEESDLIDIGNTICDGYGAGLSEDDIISALVSALIENDLADENGTEFAAALLAGATVYLCPTYA